MALTVQYAVSVDSKVNAYTPPFIPQSVIVQNYSGDNVAFDNTVDPIVLIAPGVSVPINIYHLVYTLRARTATNTTGYVNLIVSDSLQDVSHAPALQQLPTSVAITGSIPGIIGTVNTSDPTAENLLSSIQTLINDLNTLTTDINGNTGTAATNTGATANNTNTTATNVATTNTLIGTLNSLNTNIQEYTNIITGLLPTTVTPFNLNPGSEHQETISKAKSGFSLVTVANGAGRMNVWIVSGGSSTYLLRDEPLWPAPNTINPIVKRFEEPLIANDVIHVRWDDATFILNALLRY